MAKVKSPLMSAEAHGALGGLEFRLNRSGSIVGRRSIATPSRSPTLTRHQAYMSAARTAWLAMTAAQRNAWLRRRSFGQTAYQAFQLAYARMKLIGITLGGINPNSTDYTRVYNLTYVMFGAPPNQVRALWSTTGITSNGVMFYYQASYRRHSSADPAKWRFITGALVPNLGKTLTGIPRAPHLWLRCDTVHARGGYTITSDVRYFHPTWT